MWFWCYTIQMSRAFKSYENILSTHSNTNSMYVCMHIAVDPSLSFQLSLVAQCSCIYYFINISYEQNIIIFYRNLFLKWFLNELEMKQLFIARLLYSTISDECCTLLHVCWIKLSCWVILRKSKEKSKETHVDQLENHTCVHAVAFIYLHWKFDSIKFYWFFYKWYGDQM